MPEPVPVPPEEEAVLPAGEAVLSREARPTGTTVTPFMLGNELGLGLFGLQFQHVKTCRSFKYDSIFFQSIIYFKHENTKNAWLVWGKSLNEQIH